MDSLTQERLKKLYDYNPETGEFFSKKTGKALNTESGSRYVQLSISLPFNTPFSNKKRFKFYAHRIAFLYMTGRMPEETEEVDHINGDKKDNRWSNLRLASHAENNQNKPSSTSKNTSGIKGVSFHKATGRWQVSCYATFSDREIAEKAALAARKALHGDFRCEQ